METQSIAIAGGAGVAAGAGIYSLYGAVDTRAEARSLDPLRTTLREIADSSTIAHPARVLAESFGDPALRAPSGASQRVFDAHKDARVSLNQAYAYAQDTERVQVARHLGEAVGSADHLARTINGAALLKGGLGVAGIGLAAAGLAAAYVTGYRAAEQ